MKKFKRMFEKTFITRKRVHGEPRAPRYSENVEFMRALTT